MITNELKQLINDLYGGFVLPSIEIVVEESMEHKGQYRPWDQDKIFIRKDVLNNQYKLDMVILHELTHLMQRQYKCGFMFGWDTADQITQKNDDMREVLPFNEYHSKSLLEIDAWLCTLYMTMKLYSEDDTNKLASVIFSSFSLDSIEELFNIAMESEMLEDDNFIKLLTICIEGYKGLVA